MIQQTPEDSEPSSRALKTYAGWFNRKITSKDIYRVFPSDVHVEGLDTLSGNRFENMISEYTGISDYCFEIVESDLAKNRIHIKTVLKKWLNHIDSVQKAILLKYPVTHLNSFIILKQDLIKIRKDIRTGN